MKKDQIKDMSLIAVGSVVLAVCSWLTVPFVIPFTMQTFGLYILLLVLGGKRATLSVLLYIALGAIGIPVFSGFNAGVGALLGPSGGFILGFALAGVVYLSFGKKTLTSRSARLCALLLATGAFYVSGTAGYVLWCAGGSKAVSFGTSFSVCVLPYIIPDALKMSVACFVAKRIKNAIKA